MKMNGSKALLSSISKILRVTTLSHKMLVNPKTYRYFIPLTNFPKNKISSYLFVHPNLYANEEIINN